MRRIVEKLMPELDQTILGIEESDRSGPDKFIACMETFGSVLSACFSVTPGEVGILLVTDGGKVFKFAYPLELYAGGTNLFPTSKQSIAALVLKSGHGRIINDVPKTQHLHIYEQVKIARQPVRKIQKMIATPIGAGDRTPIGVIEVSRKGISPDEAGPDFRQNDLMRLRDMARRISPVVRRFLPDDF